MAISTIPKAPLFIEKVPTPLNLPNTVVAVSIFPGCMVVVLNLQEFTLF